MRKGETLSSFFQVVKQYAFHHFGIHTCFLYYDYKQKLKSKEKANQEISKQINLLVDKCYENEVLSKEDYLYILDNITEEDTVYLFKRGNEKKQDNYQNKVFAKLNY